MWPEVLFSFCQSLNLAPAVVVLYMPCQCFDWLPKTVLQKTLAVSVTWGHISRAGWLPAATISSFDEVVDQPLKKYGGRSGVDTTNGTNTKRVCLHVPISYEKGVDTTKNDDAATVIRAIDQLHFFFWCSLGRPIDVLLCTSAVFLTLVRSTHKT